MGKAAIRALCSGIQCMVAGAQCDLRYTDENKQAHKYLEDAYELTILLDRVLNYSCVSGRSSEDDCGDDVVGYSLQSMLDEIDDDEAGVEDLEDDDEEA